MAINPTRKKRNRLREKRRNLTSIVKTTLKKEKSGRFKLDWVDWLDGRLGVGYLNLRGNGNVLSIYTLNYKKPCLDLRGFRSVVISLNDRSYKNLAKDIQEELRDENYFVRIKERR